MSFLFFILIFHAFFYCIFIYYDFFSRNDPAHLRNFDPDEDVQQYANDEFEEDILDERFGKCHALEYIFTCPVIFF